MSKVQTKKTSPGGDWIHLRGVEARCVLGVYPAERRKARKVRMDISLQRELRAASRSDRLEDTLNYELVEAEAIDIAKRGSFSSSKPLRSGWRRRAWRIRGWARCAWWWTSPGRWPAPGAWRWKSAAEDRIAG